MDTILVILVLLLVIGLLLGVGYYFVRETGRANVRLWLTTPMYLRETLKAWTAKGASTDASAADPARLAGATANASTTAAVSPSETAYALAIDDTALRDLREELQGELRRATGLTREFDARLTRIETNVVEAPRASEAFQRALAEQDANHRTELDRVRHDMELLQRTTGSFGERRGDALSELYGHLSKVEAALAGVVYPMLLPGEPLTLPEKFFPETLVWDNWNDVGECAFAFGNVFNQNRFILESGTADEIERFIATLREALTEAVYPNVRAQNPSRTQLDEMRRGLQTIVASMPIVRRRLERAYRGDDATA